MIPVTPEDCLAHCRQRLTNFEYAAAIIAIKILVNDARYQARVDGIEDLYARLAPLISGNILGQPKESP